MAAGSKLLYPINLSLSEVPISSTFFTYVLQDHVVMVPLQSMYPWWRTLAEVWHRTLNYTLSLAARLVSCSPSGFWEMIHQEFGACTSVLGSNIIRGSPRL